MTRESATFGQVISSARKNSGLSQRELANRIKKENGEPISPQYLNDLERDRRNPPSEQLLIAFSRELNVPLDYLTFLAGQLPADIQQIDASPETVEKAFMAFRKTLKGPEKP